MSPVVELETPTVKPNVHITLSWQDASDLMSLLLNVRGGSGDKVWDTLYVALANVGIRSNSKLIRMEERS